MSWLAAMLLRIAENVRQMLNEASAADDVHELVSAADGQNGDLASYGEAGEFDVVELPVGVNEFRVRVLRGSVQLGAVVGAADEDEAVDEVELLADVTGVVRDGQENGYAVGKLDGGGVGVPYL